METVKSCCAHSPRAAEQPVQPSVGGPFALLDHHGAPVTEADWRGRYMLMFFGFTNCQVVCPRALARISDAMRLLGLPGQAIAPLYISVDPERDTPEVMQRYLAERAPAITGLTGSREQVDAMVKAYRVFARRVEDPDAPGGYVVPHTAMTYLFGPDGTYVAHFSDAIDAAELALRLRALLPACVD